MSTLELREERATAPRAGGGRVVTSGDLCPGRPHQGTASPFPRAAWLLSARTLHPSALLMPGAGGGRRRRASGPFLLPPALGALLTAAPVEGLSAQVTLVSLGSSVGPPSA